MVASDASGLGAAGAIRSPTTQAATYANPALTTTTVDNYDDGKDGSERTVSARREGGNAGPEDSHCTPISAGPAAS
jgi:hypothetical protein